MTEYNFLMIENLHGYNLDHDELANSVKELVAMHNGLEEQIKSMRGPLSKAAYKLKAMLWRKPKYTVEEILRNQLVVIRQLRRAIEFQAGKSESVLEIIVNYTEQKSEEIVQAIEYRQNEMPVLIENKKIIEAMAQEIAKMKKESLDFFKKDNKYRRAVMIHKNNLNKYDLASEKTIDLLGQRAYMYVQEESVSSTIHTSKRLTEKTKRIEEQLGIVKSLYDSVLKQHKLYITLYQALGVQRQYIAGLDDIISSGRETISAIASRSEVINNYHSKERLEGVCERIELEDSDRRQELELVIAESFRR